MPRFVEVVWHGGLVGGVEPWSHTRGELLSPRAQRVRAFGADALAPDDLLPPVTLPSAPAALSGTAINLSSPWSRG